FLSALRRVRVTPRVLLLLIVLLAFALRVFRLGAQAIWWDESLTVYRATRDLGTIFANTIQIQNVLTTDLQPPLYFFFEYFFVRAFGLTEFAVRVLTAFACTASVPLLYALGARVFNARVGRVAAFLAALSPFYVAYAQEARPYALVLFFVLLAVYALARAFDSGRGLTRINADKNTLNPNFPRASASTFGFWVLSFVISSIAALYSHYYAIFLFPFYVSFIAVYSWNSPRAKLWLLLPALPFASIIFLFPIILRGAAGNVLSGPSSVSLDVILLDLLNSFSVGISADARDLGWIDAAMLTLFAFGIFFATPRFQISKERNVPYAFRNSIILLAFLFIPLTALQLATLYRPLYQNSRYFIALSPAFYLGVAAGIAALAKKSLTITRAICCRTPRSRFCARMPRRSTKWKIATPCAILSARTRACGILRCMCPSTIPTRASKNFWTPKAFASSERIFPASAPRFRFRNFLPPCPSCATAPTSRVRRIFYLARRCGWLGSTRPRKLNRARAQL
ncbi:MAG: glycosyltransferase family 39 protein, partial [Chloroflexi bacterium]|nr:glycosyltransferase family 39 protein [Chloroflexota bacterium]